MYKIIYDQESLIFDQSKYIEIDLVIDHEEGGSNGPC